VTSVYEMLYAYWLIALIIGVLIALAIDFVFRFLIPAQRRLKSLRRIRDALTNASLVAAKDPGDLDAMVGEAKIEPAFAALWVEYSKTLHGQRAIDDFGQQRIVRWRATTLAETFFTDQVLVDSPLRTEYFKHLPGILTGLGHYRHFRWPN
jgi:hypothetical protein